MKVISNIMIGVSVIFFLWVGVSYAEIMIKHDRPNPVYNDYNIIINIIDSVK